MNNNNKVLEVHNNIYIFLCSVSPLLYYIYSLSKNSEIIANIFFEIQLMGGITGWNVTQQGGQ